MMNALIILSPEINARVVLHFLYYGQGVERTDGEISYTRMRELVTNGSFKSIF